jgi:hypothetical protein
MAIPVTLQPTTLVYCTAAQAAVLVQREQRYGQQAPFLDLTSSEDVLLLDYGRYGRQAPRGLIWLDRQGLPQSLGCWLSAPVGKLGQE